MKKYDVVIAGGGPIGASTAYFLSQNTALSIAIITEAPDDDPSVLYKNAGGCIRWFWDEDIKRDMTTRTAEFVKKLLDDGVELGALQDNYHFVYRGVFTPALNIRSALLVNYLLDQSEKNGVTVLRDKRVESISDDTKCTVKGKDFELTGSKVLLSMGMGNEKFMPGLKLEREKRQLFVLDLPVDSSRELLPHTIVPVGEGYGYVFLKQFPDGLKVVVGQEDIIEDEDETQAVDYFKELVASPFGDIMPWLREAKVEKILWGIDAGNKTLRVEQKGNLYSANCGSAVRACIYIGEELAKQLTD